MNFDYDSYLESRERVKRFWEFVGGLACIAVTAFVLFGLSLIHALMDGR